MWPYAALQADRRRQGLEDREIFQQRDHAENDHDHAHDLFGAAVDRQHIDEIEHQDDDKGR